MIRCPNCQKGLLWGIFLDIPPEMKSGQAVWLACEPPEFDTDVTCPACQNIAGSYGDLYAADADSRRHDRFSQNEDRRQRTQIVSLAEFKLLGCVFQGNHWRDGFLKESWEAFAQWLDLLRDEKILPRRWPERPDDLPEAFGIWLEDPDEVSSSDCRYMTAIPFPDSAHEKIQTRLSDPQYNDLKTARLLTIPEGDYARIDVELEAKALQQGFRFLKKDWLEKNAYTLRSEPVLEVYAVFPETWPPHDLQATQFKLCLPVEHLPAAETAADAEAEATEEL